MSLSLSLSLPHARAHTCAQLFTFILHVQPLKEKKKPHCPKQQNTYVAFIISQRFTQFKNARNWEAYVNKTHCVLCVLECASCRISRFLVPTSCTCLEQCGTSQTSALGIKYRSAAIGEALLWETSPGQRRVWGYCEKHFAQHLLRWTQNKHGAFKIWVWDGVKWKRLEGEQMRGFRGQSWKHREE